MIKTFHINAKKHTYYAIQFLSLFAVSIFDETQMTRVIRIYTEKVTEYLPYPYHLFSKSSNLS